jgi:hypothetical protein
VQGNVRYLGSFMGKHTHAPYTLEQISNRRFGDCKDKAMLATAMLRYLGLDAAPALVNTEEREGISENLPGQYNFDHLIVHLKLAEKEYWLDPTRTFQRGTLAGSYSPAYGFAFVIRAGANALSPVSPAGFDVTKTAITETIKIPDMSGKATMHVHTVATGSDADRLRRTFSTDSLSDIEEDYRECYEDDYPGITVSAPISFSDDETQNRIVITESYALTDLWEKVKDDGEEDRFYAWFYPRLMSGNSVVPSETERKMPYSISHPTRHIHTIEITAPEGWDLPEDAHGRKLPALDYKFNITSTPGGTVSVSYDYKTHADRILPEDFSAYREAMKLMDDDLYYHLSRPVVTTPEVGEVGKSYAFVTGFLVLGLFAGTVGSALLWFWDPASRAPDLDARFLNGIGGWMVIPALSCLLMPFINLFEVAIFYTTIDTDNFTLFSKFENQGVLQVAYGLGSSLSGFSFCLSILLLVLLFGKRTSFPILFIVLAIVDLIGDTAFIVILNHAIEADLSTGESTQFILSVFEILIWGTYMLVSQRVRQTFIRRRRMQVSPPPSPADI